MADLVGSGKRANKKIRFINFKILGKCSCKRFDKYHGRPDWQWQAGKEELSATIAALAAFLTSLLSEKLAQLNGNMYNGH